MVANNISKRHHPVFGEIDTVIYEKGTVLYDAAAVAKALGYKNPYMVASVHMKDQPQIISGTSVVKNGVVFTHRKRYCSEEAAFKLALKGSTPQCQALREWAVNAMFPLLKEHTRDWLQPFKKEDGSVVNMIFAIAQALGGKTSEFANSYTECLDRLTKE